VKQHFAKWVIASTIAASIAIAPLTSGGALTAHAAATQSAAVQSAIAVYLDGQKLALTQAPYLRNGVTFVPMAAIFKALHASVTWEQSTKTIISRKDSRTISLQIGSKTATVNGKKVALAAPAEIVKGTTYVPLRFVGETLGAEVAWQAAQHKVVITSEEALMAKEQEQLERERASKILTTSENVALNDQKVVMITTDLGQGSGVVIGPNLIMTNYHVMEGASSAQVLDVDGRTFKVEGVVASNEADDLAIIKTTTELGIEPVELANSYDINKGDPVVAIGSPLGVQNTATDGIISNFTGNDEVTYIQFSAPIDHGSSGGGLFNQYGELVGITSAGYDDVNMDINFAVSVDDVLDLLVDYITEPEQTPKFIPSKLPATLKDMTNDQLAAFMKNNFSDIQTTVEMNAELTDWTVKRDDKGWLVFEANIDPIFYTLYGEKTKDQLALWALNTGYELRNRLEGETIRIIINFDRVIDFEPQGYTQGEVTALGDGKWQLHYQGKTSAIIKLR
jgi:S1-C subfamily serine protease